MSTFSKRKYDNSTPQHFTMLWSVFSPPFSKLRSLLPHLSDRVTDMSNNYIEFRPFSNGWLFCRSQNYLHDRNFIKCTRFIIKTDILKLQTTSVSGLNIEFGSFASVGGVSYFITVGKHDNNYNKRKRTETGVFPL